MREGVAIEEKGRTKNKNWRRRKGGGPVGQKWAAKCCPRKKARPV